MAAIKGVKLEDLPDQTRKEVITKLGSSVIRPAKPRSAKPKALKSDDAAISALHALRGLSKAEKRKALQRALVILER